MNEIYKNSIHGYQNAEAIKNQFNINEGQMPSRYEEYLISKNLYETYNNNGNNHNSIYKNFK